MTAINGKGASVMKELTTEGLKLFADIDGSYWLSFGQHAHVSIDAIKRDRGQIVCRQIDEWIKRQHPKPNPRRNERLA
jgi:hypothetical protein